MIIVSIVRGGLVVTDTLAKELLNCEGDVLRNTFFCIRLNTSQKKGGVLCDSASQI